VRSRWVTEAREEGRENKMDNTRMQLEGKWDQLRGRVKEAWGTLTDDDLDRTEGKWDRLLGTIKEKTGETMETIEDKIKQLIDKADHAVSKK
jgi:uncharacterized protein YjbJ (UPF0337 family)